MSDEPFKFNVFGIPGFQRKKSKRDKKYATFNRRMLAATIDSLLLMFLAPLFNWLTPIHTESLNRYAVNSDDPLAAQHFLMQVLTDRAFTMSWVDNLMLQMIVYAALSAVCWNYWAATPGKMLFRMKIVDAKTEGPITPQQIVLRACGYFPSGICFLMGFFWIGIDKRGQAWHDKLAETLVLVKPWKTPDVLQEPA